MTVRKNESSRKVMDLHLFSFGYLITTKCNRNTFRNLLKDTVQVLSKGLYLYTYRRTGLSGEEYVKVYDIGGRILRLCSFRKFEEKVYVSIRCRD